MRLAFELLTITAAAMLATATALGVWRWLCA